MCFQTMGSYAPSSRIAFPAKPYNSLQPKVLRQTRPPMQLANTSAQIVETVQQCHWQHTSLPISQRAWLDHAGIAKFCSTPREWDNSTFLEEPRGRKDHILSQLSPFWPSGWTSLSRHNLVVESSRDTTTMRSPLHSIKLQGHTTTQLHLWPSYLPYRSWHQKIRDNRADIHTSKLSDH
jgi:hypothetical protein